jgi:hypothetical protein
MVYSKWSCKQINSSQVEFLSPFPDTGRVLDLPLANPHATGDLRANRKSMDLDVLR